MNAPLECRFCGAPLEHTFCDLGMSPVSNAFIEPEALLRMEPFYPLHAYVCSSCLLVQLADWQRPEDMFNENYAYFSSYSDSWLRHARDYVAMMVDRFGINPRHQVVEIASNDGYLLQYFRERNIPVLGIEPAANVAEAARRRGIPTWGDFFGRPAANKLEAAGRQADLLIGNNVLAHVPDVNDFVAGVRQALKPSGIFTFEFPHLLRLLEANQFDTIYHEHYSYLSWLAVERIFARHGLVLFDVEKLWTHGGSLRVFGRRAEADTNGAGERVEALRAEEKSFGLEGLDVYQTFQERVRRTKRRLLRFLIEAKDAGRRIAAYGAPAKGNTLLNFCGIGPDILDYTVDRSPRKQGRFLPGSHIPIYPPDRVFQTQPDYLLILPWNLRDEIIRQMAEIRAWGGQFVTPIPEVEVIA
jgi:SAM-dependent methyltransferase